MKKSWRNNVEFYLIGLLLLMVIAFSIAMPNIFWSVSNFQSIASQMPVLGILALAMAMTMPRACPASASVKCWLTFNPRKPLPTNRRCT